MQQEEFLLKFAYCLVFTASVLLTITWFSSAFSIEIVSTIIGAIVLLIFAVLSSAFKHISPTPSIRTLCAHATIALPLGIMLYYLSVFFNKIAKNEASTYFNSFYTLFTLLTFTQFFVLFKRNAELPLLVFLGTINVVVLVTMGIVLDKYSTQGFALLPKQGEVEEQEVKEQEVEEVEEAVERNLSWGSQLL